MNISASAHECPPDPMYQWARDLMPLPRSLSGPGVRATLAYISNLLPEVRVLEAPSGASAFDWTVPDEWSIRDAYVANEQGERIVDFRTHNLHVVGYSEPVDRWMSLAELNEHLFSLPDQPDAIPYVTSYYKRRWGFCLTHRQRQALAPGRYRAVVDSTLEPGVLNYAEALLPGETSREIVFSTYVCHPSMANNELSGPVVAAALARWLRSISVRRFTYRFVFLPETIGSIYYLSRNLEHLQATVDAGFVISCVGDGRNYSIVKSRSGATVADRVLEHVLRRHSPSPAIYSFLERGSDERQYCSPGVDLPFVGFSRTKYGEYPEYHTSLDDLSLISQAALEGSLAVLQDCVRILEANYRWRATVKCEPQLGKRGLYPDLSMKGSARSVVDMMNFLAYADGSLDLVEIACVIGVNAVGLAELANTLHANGLVAPG